jgi:hypothetical protein
MAKGLTLEKLTFTKDLEGMDSEMNRKRERLIKATLELIQDVLLTFG